jgi:glycosyltransferase involved in cell wall biosynthesis
MGGYGHKCLDELLTELKYQTLQDFEVVISDQSTDTKTLEVVQKHSDKLKIRYITDFYNRGKAACNINQAMKYAEGDIIKILYEDDFFVTQHALQIIDDAFVAGAKWTINGFTHTQDKKEFFNTKPSYYQDSVLLGRNSIGNPSNISVLNSEKIYMDENILYVVDCEYYYRLKQNLGLPVQLQNVLVCARHHPASVAHLPEFTNLLGPEVQYCLTKHNVDSTQLLDA